jgi:MinD-like ATPase involved in chromosome partitioning or flagellar assembly
VDLKAAEEFRNVLNRRMFELFKMEEEVVEGVVANMVSSREDVREIREHLDLPILGVVPFSAEMEGANREGLPLVAYRPDDPASMAFVEIAGRLLPKTDHAGGMPTKAGMRADRGRGMIDSLKERIKGILG